MKDFMSEENRTWLNQVYEKLCNKMEAECLRVGEFIPSVPENGRYIDNCEKFGVSDWVNGFWGGMMWQMYHATGKECYRVSAERVEEKLDQAFDSFDGLHHDVGFMWLPTAVADYRITGNARSRSRGLHAATLLAGRYNSRGKFIRAWNPHMRSGKMEYCTGWVIVDCLMNIPLLYWAAKETESPSFYYIAEDHAETALKYVLREDGSCNHIIEMNPDDGTFMGVLEGQGFSKTSAWSRGQAWAIYGFALSAKYTGKQKYIDAAKKVANYFIACTDRTEHISACDFRAPKEPFYPDTSAAACAACGMLEMADMLEEGERTLYLESAVELIKAAEQNYGNWNEEEDGLLMGSRGSYHSDEPDEGRSMIFGEYYYLEAIVRLMGKNLAIW